MMALFKKELAYYFNNPIGYIVAILFSVFANFLFVKDLFLRGNSSMRPFFEILPWLFLVFLPALTMRIFAEEKRVNTIEVLLTLPVSETAIVVSKWLALLVFASFSLLLTLSLPATLMIIGKPYLPEIVVSYFGAFLFASGFVALSLFFSSLTKNQIIVFMTSVLTMFLLIVLGSEFLASILPRFLHELLAYFSPLYHYDNFLKGLVDFRSVAYFISLTVLFLFLSIINLEKRG